MALAAATFPSNWPWLLGAVAANHLILGAAGMSPRSRLLGPNLVRLPPSSAHRREIALTFDDGPDPAATPAILDLLDRHRARASFFCIGRQAAAYPGLVREIHKRGHSVENHSHRHSPAFACYGPHRLAQDLGQAQETIGGIIGQAPHFFRPPMGLRNPLLYPALARFGLRHVSWTRRGYDSVSRNEAAILRRLGKGLAAGDILLMHDLGRATTGGGPGMVLNVLASLLAQLGSRGLRSVSLPMALEGHSLQHQDITRPRPAMAPPASAAGPVSGDQDGQAADQARVHPGQQDIVSNVVEM